jgi:hypothetical protein
VEPSPKASWISTPKIPNYAELMWPALQASVELGSSATVSEMYAAFRIINSEPTLGRRISRPFETFQLLSTRLLLTRPKIHC